jgi:DNA-binding LacI/PurR family transcriptional regulator
VNNTGSISPATRERVLKAIKQLNYRRHTIARSMRTGQTGLMGLIVLNIANPVLSTIASAVQQAAYDSNYKVVLYDTGMDPRRERASLEASAGGLVDGLIIVNALDHDYTVEFLKRENLTTVMIDCLATGDIHALAVDNHKAAYIATQHAIELGHRRIAHITVPSIQRHIADLREQGYLHALADHGLTYRRIARSKGQWWDYKAGYDTMQEILSSSPHPTAVFAVSDEMALGAYRAIAEAGLRVPDDFSVIGFDDIKAAAFAIPTLTTIRQPFDEMASTAVQLLVQLIAGEEPPTTQVMLPAELVIRQSTMEVS